ncbi:two-component system sensor histidine kinase VanS [Kitasatospora sp. MAP12-15]|uniref:HAMP domain-containing sensor histidine kinase n=1 Tax=unclassified Kitasatospora TaxID=2633591 RepID=UPI00247676A7|nr:ATP-binding protein [Kitasatospora sp. MAP12-44]MDH6114532.1 two-component system sensor histidine kinase VanS [Kitasatospora sp. MAP12-44]
MNRPPTGWLRWLVAWLRHPPLTIRARLTLTYATLFTIGGSALVLAMTTAFYHAIFQPLPPSAIPGRLDPDHDHILSLSDQIRDVAVSHLLRDALLLLLLVVAVSALLGWWIAGRMLRPIKAITAAARRASGTTLHERLNLPGPPDELKELGDTFDEMLQRLDSAFVTQRRFVANASHELRTPLAVTRAAVEVTLAKPAATQAQWRAMAQDVADSTEQAQRLIEALLVLARSEQRVTDSTDSSEDDLADIAAEALDQVAARRRARGLRLEVELAPAPLRGNVALLGIAVANLLENAVKYNRDGGLLLVATRRTGDGRAVELTVANDGPALEPERVEELFEPFHRGRHTRRSSGPGADGPEGAGLGLSIVRAVALAHGGTVRAAVRAEGGLALVLRLPVTPCSSTGL